MMNKTDLNNFKVTKIDLKTKSKSFVTFFAMSILGLVSLASASKVLAAASQTPQISAAQMTLHKVSTAEVQPNYKLAGVFEVSRSTSLYDFKDGSRSDGLDLLFVPALKTPIGTFSMKETYSKNLRDDNDIKAGFSDAAVTYSFGAKDWEWSPPYVLTMSPSITTVVPISELSVKKNQLQTALSGGLTFGVRPDGLGAAQAGAWNFSVGVTAGRSFHAYEEDINGAVLNKYSSNQTLSLGYTISDFSFSFDYVNRSRWTYQGNIKQSFVTTQEISYAIDDHFYTTVGHSNDEGSVLKANGYESNIDVIDENNSSVYLTLGTNF